jgi:hypothetical protein
MPTTMTPRSGAFASALVAVLLASAAAAEPLDAPPDQQPLQQPNEDVAEPFGDEPLDLTTPLPPLQGGRASATNPVAERRASTGWDARLGVDHRRPSFPAADLQPDQLLPGSVQEQSTGVAWATVTAPGLESPLGWDKTSIETRLDPTEEQGKIGTTLSRSVPVGSDVSVTLQNGYSVTRTLPSPATSAAQSWAASQTLRFNVLPTDTTLSLGAAISSGEDKWLRSLSAEQKLLGGPLSVTGSVSESGTGDTAKSLKAGFKRAW